MKWTTNQVEMMFNVGDVGSHDGPVDFTKGEWHTADKGCKYFLGGTFIIHFDSFGKRETRWFGLLNQVPMSLADRVFAATK